jgi:hypothetical protein
MMEFIYLLLPIYRSRQGCYFDPMGKLVFSRCHCRRAAAKLLPTSRCCAAATAAASAMLPPRCRRRDVPLPPRRRHAAANVALSRFRHRRSLRAAATALPPSRCAPPPRFALPPPPLMPPSCHQRPHQARTAAQLGQCPSPYWRGGHHGRGGQRRLALFLLLRSMQ